MSEAVTQPKSNRGGARPGAGRKPGRTPRAVKELTSRHIMALADLRRTVHAGLLPLEVMLYRMRGIPLPDGTMVTNDMMDAAESAAPYVHPKLQAIAVRAGDTALTQEERDRQQATRSFLLAELALLARPEPLTIDEAPSPRPDDREREIAPGGAKPPDRWE